MWDPEDGGRAVKHCLLAWPMWLGIHNTCDDLLWAYQWSVMGRGELWGPFPSMDATNDFSERDRVCLSRCGAHWVTADGFKTQLYRCLNESHKHHYQMTQDILQHTVPNSAFRWRRGFSSLRHKNRKAGNKTKLLHFSRDRQRGLGQSKLMWKPGEGTLHRGHRLPSWTTTLVSW